MAKHGGNCQSSARKHVFIPTRAAKRPGEMTAHIHLVVETHPSQLKESAASPQRLQAEVQSLKLSKTLGSDGATCMHRPNICYADTQTTRRDYVLLAVDICIDKICFFLLGLERWLQRTMHVTIRSI